MMMVVPETPKKRHPLRCWFFDFQFNYQMLSNLQEFVFKFVEKENRNNFPSLYIVDKQTGPYRKIQDAIDAAQPLSLIKVTEGFYEENLVITKPITIQPKAINGRSQQTGVILLVESGIGIHVKLPYSDSQVNLTGLKVSHTGSSSQMQMDMIEHHQHLLNIFEDREKDGEQSDHDFIMRTSFNKIDNMIFFAERGQVNITLCVFSLKYLVKSFKTMIPAICVDRESELIITDSQIKGNEMKETIGVMCRLGNVNIRNCVISEHKLGGLILWGQKDSRSKLIKNKIEKNQCGVSVVGDEFGIKICQNQIINNECGVRIGLSAMADVSRNVISQNGSGIEIISSFPLIYLNKIDKNRENGISIKIHKSLTCKAIIKKNVSISGNKLNGILIEGKKNRSQVSENYLIGFNGESGIKINNKAFPLILKNKIYKNYKQGILVTEHANAVIEKNYILYNIDCNVALGGKGSHQTLLVENSIKFSPGCGIILAEGNSHISRNDIAENREGIKMISSSGNIRKNYIAHNKDNGVTCKGFCTPTLVENVITRNASLGLFLCEDSGISKYSMIHSNIIVSNQINVGLQFSHQTLVQDLKSSNTIDGDIEEPIPIKCRIM